MKKLSAALMALLLSACSSQVYVPGQETIQHNVKPLDRDMYLRGDFTLWDAEPHYKLGAQQPGIYTVRAKFMTPGKVYEFKIADESWSKGFNCGYQSSGSLQLNKPIPANCDTVYNYFSFAPSKKGWYTITFDYRNSASPMVMVSKG